MKAEFCSIRFACLKTACGEKKKKTCLCAYFIAICEYLSYIFYMPEVKNVKQLFIYCSPHWAIIASLVLFSSCVVTGGHSLVVVHGFSCYGAQTPGQVGFNSFGSWALLLYATWNLPGQGIKPVSLH